MHAIWKDRYFRRYFTAFTIGNIGDWFAFFALQLYVVHTWQGSALAVSALFFVYFLPGAVLAPFFGVWVDRLSPTWLWSITDLISGVLTVLIIFAPSLPWVLGLLLIRSVSVAYNDPTMQRMLKCLVSEAEPLRYASGITSMAFQLCRIIGPMLGALFVAWWSIQSCLWIDAASFFISAGIAVTFIKGWSVPTITDAQESVSGFWHELCEGWQYVWQHTELRRLFLLCVPSLFALIMTEAQFVTLLKVLAPQQPELLGWLTGVSGIASLIVGYLLTRYETLAKFYMVSVALVLQALSYLALGLCSVHTGLTWLVAIMLLHGAGFGLVMVLFGYLLQHFLPADKIGRISSLSRMSNNAAMLFGAMISGFLVLSLGISVLFILVAVIMICFVAIAAFLWRLR